MFVLLRLICTLTRSYCCVFFLTVKMQGISVCSKDPEMTNCQFPAKCVNGRDDYSCLCSNGFFGVSPNCEGEYMIVRSISNSKYADLYLALSCQIELLRKNDDDLSLQSNRGRRTLKSFPNNRSLKATCMCPGVTLRSITVKMLPGLTMRMKIIRCRPRKSLRGYSFPDWVHASLYTGQ